MKNIYHFMKGFKLIILFLGAILILSVNAVFAQSVNITVNILPPYSPFYSDYAGPNASKVFLTVQNLTNTTKSIKLTGQLTGDNGIKISTKSNYTPLQPITLGPNQVRQLNGTALKDIFDLNSLNVYGIDKVKLVQTSRLPEGNYNFCVQAVDVTNNQVLSANAALGCSNISITYPDAPILISPQTDIFATTPQSVVFNWINAGFAPVGTQYILQIAEVPIGTRNSNQLLNSVSFPLVNKTLNGFSYILSPADPPLVIGKTYTWRVKAIDPSGKVVFKNGGVSAANTFIYKAPVILASMPTLVSPVNEANVTTLEGGLPFNWNMNGTVTPNTNYTLQVVQMPKTGGNAQQLFEAGAFVINETIKKLNYTLTATSMPLVYGNRYAWRVVATQERTSRTLDKGNVSAINIFNYKAINYIDPPILLSPNGGQISLLAANNATFRWQKSQNITGNFEYTLQLLELPTTGTDPAPLFNGNAFLINKITNDTSFISTTQNIDFKIGKRYAWRVKMRDLSGKYQFKNNGISSIAIFDCSNVVASEKLPAAPMITSPTNQQLFTQLDDLTQPNINVTWKASIATYPLNYRVVISKIPFGIEPKIAVEANLQTVYDAEHTGTSVTLVNKTNGNNANAIANLEDGATYAIQVIVTGKDKNGDLLRFDNNGRSNVVAFTYKEKPKVAVEPPAPILSTIAGRFLYRYKEATDYPKNSSLGLPKVISTQVFGLAYSPVPKYSYKVAYNDYPDYAASGRFPLNGTEKPLKNVGISFTYTLVVSKTLNPQNYNELQEPGNLSSQYIEGKYLDLNGEKIYFDKVVSFTRLKDDGSFSFTFTNKYKLGFLGVKDGKYYFGVIRPMIIDDGYFASSEMLIFPKVGKTTVLPDEMVFANSYNVDLTLIANKSIKNQAVDGGKVLSNYPVNVLDMHKYLQTDGPGQVKTVYDKEDNLLTMPAEADANNYIGQTANSAGMDLPIVAIAKTDEFGIAHIKNLLPHHTHLLMGALNPFEGNFNYKPETMRIMTNGIKEKDNGTTAGIITEEYDLGYNFSAPTFNSNFKQITVKAQLSLKPKKPEIYLRAITIQNGVPMGIANAYVTVTSYSSNFIFAAKVTDDTYKTDANGYFQLGDLKEDMYRTIVISKFGFVDKVVANKQMIKLGERFPASVEQELKGAGTIVGKVVNEKGEPVVANVRVGKGPFIKTSNSGFFSIENVPTLGQAVEIVPVVDNYFGETLYPYIKPGESTLITTPNGNATSRIILKEKLHRVRFNVVDDDDNKPIRSDIGIGNSALSWYINDPYTGLTDEIAIASPGTEFKVRIVKYGYVAYDDYMEIPLGKTPKTITIRLKKAQVISGIVKDAITGAPIVGARVYSVNGTNADGEIQNSTTTGTDGRYTLYGAINPKVWIGFAQFFQELPIRVYAVKSGSPSYVRAEIDASPSSKNANFALTPLTTNAEIWGLPIEVHSLNRVNYYTSVITGAFVRMPANKSFKLENGDTKLPFKQIAVTTSAKGFEPATAAIDVEAISLKVTAYDKYACEVIGSDKENVYNKLSIKKTDGYGALTGYLTSELSSFNFSYEYDGKFLVGDYYRLGNGGGNVNTPTKVFSSTPNFATSERYGLQGLYGKNSFAIHNFNATMKGGSKLSASGYNINADVSLNIPLLGVQSISAGSLNVTQNNIEWTQFTGNLSLPLESWKITGTGLMYDINQGGFKVLNGALVTDLPQVNLKDLLIMPTSIDLGTTNLTGKENLSLANVTPLKLTSGARMTLNYDAAASFDQKPHYRLNLSSQNKSVAYINGLPGMGNSQVNINMLSTYSDGKHKTILVEPTKVNYYNVVSQTVTGIEVTDSFFTLIGNTNLEIPGAGANVTGRFKYLKNIFDPNANAEGVVLNIEKLQTDVEMEGKVKFEGLAYRIKENLLEVDGNVHIYKNTLSDAIKGIKGTITKRPNEIKMDFLPDQRITMGNKYMLITKGSSKVQSNKWNLVEFTGQPIGYGETGKDGKIKKDLFAAGNNLIDFQVNGAIEGLKNGKSIKMEGLNTPFGDLSITFDFDAGIFNGSLVFNKAEIMLGYMKVQDGEANLQIDKNGVIFVGTITNAELNTGISLPGVLTSNFKSGIALGYYDAAIPSHLANKLLGVTLYSGLPPSLNKGLKGFYINMMKSLTKADLPRLPGPNLKSIPIVGSFVPVFDFSAGIDMYLLVNFNNGADISIGGQANASASLLYDLELCTIGASIAGFGNFDLHYTNSNLTGSLNFGLEGGLSYCIGNLNIGAALLMSKEASGFKFKPSLK